MLEPKQRSSELDAPRVLAAPAAVVRRKLAASLLQSLTKDREVATPFSPSFLV